MNAVLIPIYKEIISVEEGISLKQCFNILSSHKIILVLPENLDCTVYEQLALDNNITLYKEYFATKFFKDIAGYNKLMLSLDFYERFITYKYILIYQLDSFVFFDQLDYWCSLNYDFIGAPLIGDHKNYVFDNNFIAGNGGFSLRKTKTFIDCFKRESNLFPNSEIYNRVKDFRFVKRIILLISMRFGYRNSFSYYNSLWLHNEDVFWSIFLKNSCLELSIPSITDCIKFSFERFPSQLFKINNNDLPFGCHAWEKYEYEEFWIKYIPFC